MNNNLHIAAVKFSSMANMVSEASRYTMAASLEGDVWLGPVRQQMESLKKYMAEIERLIDSRAQSDESF